MYELINLIIEHNLSLSGHLLGLSNIHKKPQNGVRSRRASRFPIPRGLLFGGLGGLRRRGGGLSPPVEAVETFTAPQLGAATATAAVAAAGLHIVLAAACKSDISLVHHTVAPEVTQSFSFGSDTFRTFYLSLLVISFPSPPELEIHRLRSHRRRRQGRRGRRRRRKRRAAARRSARQRRSRNAERRNASREAVWGNDARRTSGMETASKCVYCYSARQGENGRGCVAGSF